MTAVERIRDEIAHAEYGAHAGTTVELWTEEAEALCDLADAARKALNCERYSAVQQIALNDVRRALARLDGEDGQ